MGEKKNEDFIQRTLVLIKPDGVRRGLIGEIISRFEKAGLKIVGIKFIKFTKELARKFYEEHINKPFYPGLEKFMTSGPVVAIVFEGIKAVEVVRKIIGPTDCSKAPPGTIRGDLAHTSLELGPMNVIHGSSSLEDAKREISLLFKEEELIEYRRHGEEDIFFS